ncbi:MAG: LPS assembly lipoprotein LptE [Bdellovibrionota bacterium]
MLQQSEFNRISSTTAHSSSVRTTAQRSVTRARGAILALVALLCAGCGYSFQGSGSILPQDIKTIAIPLVENNTTTPGLGQRFTEALRSRFDRYGAVRVVEDEAGADAVFRAKIDNVDSRVSNVTSNTDIELESELILTVSAELRRRNGQLLYRNSGMNISDSAASVGNVVVTSSSQFAQSGIQSSSLDTLSSREVARGQSRQVLDDLLDEASRRLYLEAVAADF